MFWGPEYTSAAPGRELKLTAMSDRRGHVGRRRHGSLEGCCLQRTHGTRQAPSSVVRLFLTPGLGFIGWELMDLFP